ncbi:MAG: primosomal protein N' [Casimicrobiaceae bacterium]
MTIVATALPVAAWTTFDYWAPEGAATHIGAVVRVPLGRRSVVGVVVDIPSEAGVAAEKLQPVTAHVAAVPNLSQDLLALAAFVSGYYQQPLGMVLAQMLPPIAGDGRRATAVAGWRLTVSGQAALRGHVTRSAALRGVLADWARGGVLVATAFAAFPDGAKRAIRDWVAAGYVEALSAVPATGAAATVLPPLNAAQVAAVEAIDAARGYEPFLLQGVTGSGKTEVYIAAAEAVIARGGQVLVLVPEINLTPQLEQRLSTALAGRRVVTLHSRLAAGERLRAYAQAARGEVDLVLGTRLAVFAPLPRLALVVIDEEHDASFKQQDNVRYHARDVAVWRAWQRNVPIVLGSATPSLESLQHARTGRYRALALLQRAVAPARLPGIRFEPAHGTAAHDGLGPALVAGITARLDRGEQSLVFVNRRGYAPSLLCGACGWRAQCPNCSARLVVHRSAGALRCHHCGHATRMPRHCPTCGNVDLLPMGHGTQRLEDALRGLFPAARIARVDRDTTQRIGAFASMRTAIAAGTIDILVGTQMLAKGHDFPRLTLVGVLGADNALYSADFRATERLASLLFQVAGRAGRAALPGEVIIATDFADHPLYQAVAAHDYDRLATALLEEREAAGLPPFSHLAMLAAEAPTREAVDAFLQAASARGRDCVGSLGLPVEVFAPVPATMARRAGMERGQVLAQSLQRGALQRLLPEWRGLLEDIRASRVHWTLDVDPIAVS